MPPLQQETLSDKFRVQVVHILGDMIGHWDRQSRYQGYNSPTNLAWEAIFDTVCREHGVFALGGGIDPQEECANYVLRAERDAVLDLIEVAFGLMESAAADWAQHRRNRRVLASLSTREATEDSNRRCTENGVGFRYASSQIVPTASEFVHAEMVEPALRLLHHQGFSGAHDEFMRAHAHLRQHDYKAAINECLKAFESTMKTVCTRKGWAHKPTDTAKSLLDTLYREKHVPDYLQNGFAGLRSVLEGVVPTVRNKTSGHGQGETLVEVPRPLAEYAIHVTAANILLLVNLP